MMELACISELKSYVNSSLATHRATHAGQVLTEVLDKER
jgi:hypothetical protein